MEISITKKTRQFNSFERTTRPFFFFFFLTAWKTLRPPLPPSLSENQKQPEATDILMDHRN